MRILLAGLEPEFVERCALHFRDRGWECAFSDNATDAISSLRDIRPEAIVFDVDIPWGSGSGIMARMHGEPGLPIVPAIALTDSLQTYEARQIRGYPIADIVLRPVAPEELAQRIAFAVLGTSFAPPAAPIPEASHESL